MLRKMSVFRPIALLTAFLCAATPTRAVEYLPFVYSGHLYIDVTLSSRHEARFIYDTGAGFSCIDSTYHAAVPALREVPATWARLSGIGNGEQRVPLLVSPLTFAAGGFKGRLTPASVVDLRTIIGRQADGIIGQQAFGKGALGIEFSTGRLALYAPGEKLPVQGYKRYALRKTKKGFWCIRARFVLDGRSVEGDFLIDTGTSGSLVLTAETAARYGILAASKPQNRLDCAAGGLGGASSCVYMRADSLCVGEATLLDIPVACSLDTAGMLSARDYAGIVGNRLLQCFDLLFDPARAALYLRLRPEMPEKLHHARGNVLGFSYVDRTDIGRGWIVNGVFARSHAACAGLQTGDCIMALDGRPTADIPWEEVQAYREEARRLRFGEAVRLTVERDGALREIVLPVDDAVF